MERKLTDVDSGLVHNGVDFEDDRGFEIDETISENKNTKRKTETDMRIFYAYLSSLHENRRTEDIPVSQLDRYLTMFFSVVKKHDGNDYEPASLRGMLCSIERFLRTKNYMHSITRDIAFINTRNALKNRQRALRETGKEMKAFVPEYLGPGTMERLDHLYNAKELGAHSPMSVINSLCFDFVVHFRMRKSIDHKQLLWGDISLKMSADNTEYICYQPVQSYDVCRPKLLWIKDGKIWAKSTDSPHRDSVSIYKLYARKRPNEMMGPESPFYLGVSTVCPLANDPWYKATPMGVNKLNDLVRMVRDITGLPHSIGSHIESADSSGMDNIMPTSPSLDSTPVSFSCPSVPPGGVAAVSKSKNVFLHNPDSLMTFRRAERASTSDSVHENATMALSEAKANVRNLVSALASGSRCEFVEWLHSLRIGNFNNGDILEESPGTGVSTVQLTFDLNHAESITAEPKLVTASLKRILSTKSPEPCDTRRYSCRTAAETEWCAPQPIFAQSETITRNQETGTESRSFLADRKQRADDSSCDGGNSTEYENLPETYRHKRGYKRSHSFPNNDNSKFNKDDSLDLKYPRMAENGVLTNIAHERPSSNGDMTTEDIGPMATPQIPLNTNASFLPFPATVPFSSPLVHVTDPRYAILLRNAELFQHSMARPDGYPSSIEEAYLMQQDHQSADSSSPFSAERAADHTSYANYQLVHLRERALHLSMLMAKLAAEQTKHEPHEKGPTELANQLAITLSNSKTISK